MKTILLTLVSALLLTAQANYRRAPGFTLPDTTQKFHDLADYRGKVVVLEFMRTDCPKCKSVTAALEKVKPNYAGKLQILSVVTMPDNLKSVQGYISENKVTSPVLFDCGQMIASYLKLGPSNPSVHMPTVYVIDRNGMIRREMKGDEATPTEVIGAIQAAMQ